jgi:hypothetical protein
MAELLSDNAGSRPPICGCPLLINPRANQIRVPLPFMRNATTAPIKNITNNIFAIPAADAAMPPKPNTAAMSAMTRNTTA